MNEPYIEKPDTRQVQEGDMFCYRDANRVCDSTCVAFLVVIPDGDDYTEQPWARCHVLVNEHRQGKHLTVLASIGAEMKKQFHINQADMKRLRGSGF